MAIVDDPKFTLLFVAHLIRCAPVIQKLQDILKPDDFHRAGEQGYRMLWAISHEWYASENKTIPREYLEMHVRQRLHNAPGAMMDSEVQSLYLDINGIYSFPDELFVPTKMIKYAQEFLDERRVRPAAQGLMLSAAGSDFEKQLETLRTTHASTRVATAQILDDMFTPTGITFKNTERVPTHVECIDKLLGGGTSAGEVYGILGPTGGGKTTLGSAITIDVARHGRYAGFFSYETELIPQVTNKLYGYAGDIPRNAMKNIKDVNGLPESYRVQLAEALGAYGHRIKACDMKKDVIHGTGSGGVQELRSQLKYYHDRGEHIDVVIIDQLLAMVDSWILAHNEDINNRRIFMQLFIEQLREMAQTSQMNCCVFILHQVRSEVKSASPSRRPKKGDAAEDRSFDNNLHFCVQLGTQDHNRRCWLASPKAREDDEQALIVELDPEYWQFNWAENMFEFTGGMFIRRSSEEASRNLESVAKHDEKKKRRRLAITDDDVR